MTEGMKGLRGKNKPNQSQLQAGERNTNKLNKSINLQYLVCRTGYDWFIESPA